ncbi:hypothetical protein D3C81_2043110 [compost metagenome]|jgi:SlyX protein
MSDTQTSDALHRAQERITELEIKSSYVEDTLDQLNMAMYRQQQQIDALIAEVRNLRQQVPTDGGGGGRNLRDELPPHY